MAIPSDKELSLAGWEAGREVSRSASSFQFQEAFAVAVKRAVIEALAEEARGQFHQAFAFNGSDTVTGVWFEVND